VNRLCKSARSAIYPASIAEEVSQERLRKFFEPVEGGGYRIAKWLRDCCLFSRHDVTRAPPFAKVDLVSCRNVLIYFDAELQKVVLPIFHYALNPDGILLLGKSESVGTFTELFSLIGKTDKLYTRKQVSRPLRIQLPMSRYAAEKLDVGHKSTDPMPGRIDVKRELERLALSEYAPPAVVVNSSFEIVQSQGNTSPFLGLSPGQPTFSLLRMAHPELISDLRAAVLEARKKDGPFKKEGLSIRDNGKLRTLNVRVVPIPIGIQSKERYYTIFFEEITSPKRGGAGARETGSKTSSRTLSRDEIATKEKHHLEIQKKLTANQEYQQSLIEEYETS